MPFRSAPFYVMLAVPAFYFGTTSATEPADSGAIKVSPPVENTVAPQGRQMVPFVRRNPFVGDWGPIAAYVANNWIARFTPDGRMSIEGPGLTARGFYTAHRNLAIVNYRWRDGVMPSQRMLGVATYILSDDGELTFTTGIKNDPPVHLRMIR